MECTTTFDLAESFAAGQRIGSLLRGLSRVAHQTLFDGDRAVREAVAAVEAKGVDDDAAVRRAAWKRLLDATVPLASLHELVAQVTSAERRAESAVDDVAATVEMMVDVTRRDLPAALLPPGLRQQLATVAAAGTDADAFARSMLGVTTPSETASIARALSWATRMRMRALNAVVLSEVAAAGASAAAPDAQLAAIADDAEARTATLLERAHAAAAELRRERATPGFALALWGAVYEFEEWLTKTGTTALARLAAAATRHVADGGAGSERWARRAAAAYDAVRHGLAYDAGARAALLAYATHDARALTAFARTARLPRPTATPDLPRSELADVASAPRGERVEIAGVVSAATFRLNGASNRSVLRLGPSGAVSVLVPHVAVSSFGVDAGVWVQVRGDAYPDGKDDIAGPVVMAGRVRGADAARESFSDALVFAGRRSFELRPGDLDVVAGRIAGSRVTLNEIGMRR